MYTFKHENTILREISLLFWLSLKSIAANLHVDCLYQYSNGGASFDTAQLMKAL